MELALKPIVAALLAAIFISSAAADNQGRVEESIRRLMTESISDGAVTAAKLATGSVTSAKILDGTIASVDISASAAIPESKLSLNFPTVQQSAFTVKTSINLNSTADQLITITHAKYVVRRIIVTNASTSISLAAGGVYTAASKGGTAVVAAGQLYSSLTTATKFVDLTIASLTDVQSSSLYLSLTVAQGGAATADVYVIGDVLP